MVSTSKILIVDDDLRICRTLSRYLMLEGYTVSTTTNGKEMRQQPAEFAPDLILLDLRLPGEDGLTLAQQLRAKSDIAIIMLTGKSDTIDRIVGLEIGADDYVTKPFDERELLARIRSVLRRSCKAASMGTDSSNELSVAIFEGWTLDLDAQELTSPEGEEIRMTNYEFKLLEAFVHNPNRVLNRDQIMMDIAGHEWMPLDRSIDVLVRKLRKKLREDAQRPGLIKTVRGTGYKFAAHVEFE